MKVYEAVARTLKDIGVGTLFGLIGDANIFMVNSFVKDCEGDYIGAANEAGATLMALGYASVSGRVGVATVTCGPGFTNTMTPLVEGVRAHLPMVLIAGQAPAREKFSPQKISHRDFAIAAGAGYEKAESVGTICRDLVLAFRRAESEQRPIVFDMVPYDFMGKESEGYNGNARLSIKRSCEVVDSQELDAAIGIIATAKRPLIIVGYGAIKDDAREEILSLARRIDAPIMTTVRAKDWYFGDPLNLDIFGYSARPETTEVVTDSDCIISFGASLNFITTLRGALFRGKRTISINNNSSDIDKHVDTSIAVLADCKSAARRIIYWLDEAEIAPSGFASESLVRGAVKAVAIPPRALRSSSRNPGSSDEVNLQEIFGEIASAIDARYVLATGLGRHAGYTWHAFHVEEPRLFVPGHSYGAIGLTLSLAIGAAKAEPEMTTVVTTGDGAFMLGDMSEFNTAVRYGLDLVVIVCNDGSYGAEYEQLTYSDMDPSITIFDWPDFSSVAKSLGGASMVVRERADLEKMKETIAARDRKVPLLIEIKKDPSEIRRFQGVKISQL